MKGLAKVIGRCAAGARDGRISEVLWREESENPQSHVCPTASLEGEGFVLYLLKWTGPMHQRRAEQVLLSLRLCDFASCSNGITQSRKESSARRLRRLRYPLKTGGSTIPDGD